MTSILVIELTASVGYLGLLANNGIVSLAWISNRPWLVNAFDAARVDRALVTNGRISTRQGCVGLSHIHNEYPYRRYEQ